MDELLCPLTEEKTHFDDCIDSIETSDEELLPINCYKFRKPSNEDNCNTITDNPVVNSLTKIKQKCDSNSTSNESKVSEENIELKKKSVKSYYDECPVCNSFGPKSITHIKQCAHKRSVDPKRVIQLLKTCKKTEISVDFQKRKQFNSNAKRVKKSNNKKINNYVISFEEQNALKLSVDPQLVCNKKAVNQPMNYELSVLDINQKQLLLESKISDQIISNVVNNFAVQEDIDKVLVPNIWKVALLESDLNDYIVDDFEKYHN